MTFERLTTSYSSSILYSGPQIYQPLYYVYNTEKSSCIFPVTVITTTPAPIVIDISVAYDIRDFT